jgi:hypothetical protein
MPTRSSPAWVSQRGAGMDSLSAALAAAEMLLPYGWDLANVSDRHRVSAR